MGFFRTIVDDYNKKRDEINNKCDSLIIEADTAINRIGTFFSDTVGYIDPYMGIEWNEELSSVLKHLNESISSLKRAKRYKELIEKAGKINQYLEKLDSEISEYNEQMALSQIQSAYEVIGNVEGRRLDTQQMSCIVKDVKNNLVIAGAGTGKTTTIVGKIKYLLNTGKFTYKDILVLSFTNASASEMSDRIKKETGQNVEAKTFHKLGMEILTKVEGKVPNISNLDLRKFIKK